ncbi:MAG: chorismate synthase [Bacteroidales bacterium]
MSANTIGNVLKLTSFGESHGPAIGGVLDGFPPGIYLDESFIAQELKRRKPMHISGGTAREEADQLQVLSGVFEQQSTGAPLAFLIENKNQNPADYQGLKDIYRPSHADYCWEQKFGIRDYRGGGRSSARETAVRVVAGAMAKLLLKREEIEIVSAVTRIGAVATDKGIGHLTKSQALDLTYGFADKGRSREVEKYIAMLREEGDTVGGVISCEIRNVAVGLGAPVYHKLHADLGAAMLGINAVKGFETGEGFAAAQMKGSEHNDAWIMDDDTMSTKTNHAGGILGGISSGQTIRFNIAFKPVSSIQKKQRTLSRQKQETTIEITGRHDVCVVPRALPVVEAMAALVIADHLLWSKTTKVS